MQYKHFIIFFLLFIIACNGSQQNQVVEQKLENKIYEATDFISAGDIVWCQKNYDALISLFDVGDKDLTVQDKLTVRTALQLLTYPNNLGKMNELYESEEKLDYLQRTVNLLIPNYNELDYQELLELKVGLSLSATENKFGFESTYENLERSTSVCSSWKETVNS